MEGGPINAGWIVEIKFVATSRRKVRSVAIKIVQRQTRGISVQGNDEVKPIFEAWLKPFHDLGATTVAGATSAMNRRPGGTDHTSFDYVGLPGFDLCFVPVSEPKVEQNRVHLDLASESAADQAAIVSRLLELGARPADVGQGPDVPWVVLADPDGNEFCVLSPQ